MTDAEILSKGRGKQLPITEISRDLMEGKVEPCSLSDAIEIEELVYDTYQMSDKHNMYEEEEAVLRKKGYFDR